MNATMGATAAHCDVCSIDFIHPEVDDVSAVFAAEPLTLLVLTFFIFVAWMAGFLLKFLRSSPIVGYLVMGVIFGPPLLAFFHVKGACAAGPGLVQLGHLGVMILTVLAGLETDLRLLKKMAVRGLFCAITGVGLPLGLGMVIGAVGFKWDLLIAVAAGAALAPTSLGLSLELLNEVHLCKTPVGVLIEGKSVLKIALLRNQLTPFFNKSLPHGMISLV